MVLLILAGVWAAVIIVPLVRARTEGTFGDSIGSFRRHLSVLERAAPTMVRPANRLRTPVPQSSIPPYRAPIQGRPRPQRPSMATGPVRQANAVSAAALNARRRRAQRRRRDVLFALLAGMAGSFLLSMISGLHAMIFVHILLDVLFVGYVALLIRTRNVAAEREMKLTFLPSAMPANAVPAMVHDEVEEPQRFARASGYGGSEYNLPSGY